MQAAINEGRKEGRGKTNCCLVVEDEPVVEFEKNNPQGGNLNKCLQGAHLEFSQRHRLCTHNHTHNLHYVSNNLRLSTIEEGLKSFKREVGEKPPREVGKRVRVRVRA